MKNIFLIVLLLNFTQVIAQRNISLNTTPKKLIQPSSKDRINNLEENNFWGLYANSYKNQFPRNSLALRFEQESTSKIYNANFWKWGTLHKRTILISGHSDVEIIDALITKENASNYRYRIIQNDNKELLGWTIPKTFRKTKDGLYTYCFLAKLAYKEGQFLQIEIYNINDYKDRDAIIIDWRPTRKLSFWTFIEYRKQNFKYELRSASLNADKKSTDVNFIATDTLKDIKFRLGDSLITMGFKSQNEPTAYDYEISLKSIVEGKIKVKNLGVCIGTYFLPKEFWSVSGRYELMFTPKLRSIRGDEVTYVKEQTSTYVFTVLPELNPKKLFSQRQMAFFGMILALCFLGLFVITITFFKRISAKKLDKQFQQKELIRLQLSSIRSQLNPHFMFNALASIQNLMNRNKIDEANNYLSKFARLTRNVLDEKELVSLQEEKELLADYLQMEQLRFGFNYAITTDKKLDLNNIEIPAMLLQPFVENAVKYGIAQKNNKGKIEVLFKKENLDLILAITDNGDGFDSDKTYPGLGLQLSKNRITLLNKIYQATPFILKITSTANGTTISITLTQWL